MAKIASHNKNLEEVCTDKEAYKCLILLKENSI